MSLSTRFRGLNTIDSDVPIYHPGIADAWPPVNISATALGASEEGPRYSPSTIGITRG